MNDNSHHGGAGFDKLRTQLKKELEEAGEKTGATGKFPDGKLVNQDEGELRLAVASTEDGRVIIEFGKPIAWLGLTKKEAAQLGNLILKHARG